MALTPRIRAAIVAASLAALGAPPIRAQSVSPATPAANSGNGPALSPQALVDRDLAALNSQLLRPASAPPRADEIPAAQLREEAARRLLSRPSPTAVNYLLDALQSPAVAHDVKIAVCRAIADAPQPDPLLATALAPLLGGERALSDAAARALARFGSMPLARSRLTAFAQNQAAPSAMRIAAIRAMGSIVSRDVADALVALANDPREPNAIRFAAAEALGDLTGQGASRGGGDYWKQWQQASAGKSDLAWRADVLAGREAALARDTHAQSDFANELKQILDEQYQQGTRQAKFAIVMRLLNSPDAQARAMGVQRVIDEHDLTHPFPPEAQPRLRGLIGDSDWAVRYIAAQAIRDLNDAEALAPILTQLPQETNAEVKVALVNALVPMNNVSAAPALRALLSDSSLRVADEAAITLRKLAPLLQQQDPAAARALAAEAWKVGNDRRLEPGGTEFFADAVELIGALHAREMTHPILNLLSVNNDARLRTAALRALGDIGDHQTSNPIARWLYTEPSAALRIEAIRALGATSNFGEAADTLFAFTSPNNEPDPAVRERAWKEFESLLPSASSAQLLNRWQAQPELQNDPARRLPVLLAYNDKLTAEAKWEDLAASRQNTGETYLKLGDPARAATQFAQALDYWQKLNVQNQVTERLVQQLLQSLLAAREYAQVAEVAGEQIGRNRAMQTQVGPLIRDAASTLAEARDPAKQRDALDLIDKALKIHPPLDDRYQNDLRDIQSRLKPGR